MTEWSLTKGKQVLTALERLDWQIKRQTGSHKVLYKEGWGNYIFAFRDQEEIGVKMLIRIAKKTGLKPEDL